MNSSETTAAPNNSFGNGVTQDATDGVEFFQRENLFFAIYCPIILVIGTVGNLLNIIIMLRKKNRKGATTLYLLTLALSDLVFLYTEPLRLFIKNVWTAVNLRTFSSASCKLQVYFTYTSKQFSPWLLVAVTMERVVCILFPHKVRLLSTRRVAGIVIGTMLLCILVLNVHILVYAEVIAGPDAYCDVKDENYRLFNDYGFPWVDFCVTFLLPFLFIAVGNTVILTSLMKRDQIRRGMRYSTNPHVKREERFRSLLVLLILACVFFLCTMTPSSIYFIGIGYWTNDWVDITPAHLKALKAVEAISYLNSTMNFYLYCLSGSRFRGDVVELLCCKSEGTSETIFDNSRPSRLTSTVSSPRISVSDDTQSVEHSVGCVEP